MLPSFESAVKQIKEDVGWVLIKKARMRFFIKRLLIWIGILAIIAFGLYLFAKSSENDNEFLFYLGLGIMIAPLFVGGKLDKIIFDDYSWYYKEFVIYKMMDRIVQNTNYPNVPGSKKKMPLRTLWSSEGEDAEPVALVCQFGV